MYIYIYRILLLWDAPSPIHPGKGRFVGIPCESLLVVSVTGQGAPNCILRILSLVDVVNKMSIRYHMLRCLTTKCDGQHTLVAVRTSSEAFFCPCV